MWLFYKISVSDVERPVMKQEKQNTTKLRQDFTGEMLSYLGFTYFSFIYLSKDNQFTIDDRKLMRA